MCISSKFLGRTVLENLGTVKLQVKCIGKLSTLAQFLLHCGISIVQPRNISHTEKGYRLQTIQAHQVVQEKLIPSNLLSIILIVNADEPKNDPKRRKMLA